MATAKSVINSNTIVLSGGDSTGYVEIDGLTSGGLRLTVADASAFLVTATLAAQTSGTAALTIPDFAGQANTFVFTALAQSLSAKTLVSPVISTGLTASGSAANTFAGSTGTFITSTGANTFKGSAHNFDAVLQPTTDDAAALGTTLLGFADLFLATGGTLHFANTDWVATHTTGVLTVGTGEIRITTVGTNTASVVTVGGTQTLTNKTLTSPTMTAPVLGVATGTSLAVTGLITSSSPSAGIGYATGAGVAATQSSSITTTVVGNGASGTITTVSSTLATGVDASFTFTNSSIAANDVVVVSTKSYGGTADGIPVAAVQATASGSCIINIMNNGAVTLDAPIVLNFAVIKAVAA